MDVEMKTFGQHTFVEEAGDLTKSILRFERMRARLGLCRSTAYLRIQQGLLVPGVRTGPRTVGWISAEVDAIYHSFAAGQDEAVIRALVKKLVAERGRTET